MVAYNFQKRFITPIQTGLKHQTMRPERQGSCRHARVGEAAQIYTGLRTKKAWKIIPDPIVLNISKMWLRVNPFEMKMVKQDGLTGKRWQLSQEEMQLFAVHDGFGVQPAEAYRGLLGFWLETYGTGNFCPVLIEWQPPMPGSII
jgi:hypothetical protein